jgi:hypothetical protein
MATVAADLSQLRNNLNHSYGENTGKHLLISGSTNIIKLT